MTRFGYLSTSTVAGALLILSTGVASSQRLEDSTVGEIRTFAMNFCPQGNALADGEVLNTSDSFDLFWEIRDKFGGDGVRTFALPIQKPDYTVDDRPLAKCITEDGTWPIRP